MLEVNEIFYSLQGEGKWAGTPMTFIRLAGCNLKCPFCDTDYSRKWTAEEHAMVEQVEKFPARTVCITGGEPTIQDLDYLTQDLFNRGFQIHLETNGSNPIPNSERFSWITVSPKSFNLCRGTMMMASEIKFLVGTPNWKDLIINVLSLYHGLDHAQYLLMPVWYGEGTLDNAKNAAYLMNLRRAIDFCKEMPHRFRLCLQTQKYIEIR